MYSIVKHFHVILVITSITLFQLRYWHYQVGQHVAPKPMIYLPHSIDTLLMLSGITLAIWASFSPLQIEWLLFKLLALLAYIIFGMLAMKKSGWLRWLNYAAASMAALYMIMAATQKSATPSLSFYLL